MLRRAAPSSCTLENADVMKVGEEHDGDAMPSVKIYTKKDFSARMMRRIQLAAEERAAAQRQIQEERQAADFELKRAEEAKAKAKRERDAAIAEGKMERSRVVTTTSDDSGGFNPLSVLVPVAGLGVLGAGAFALFGDDEDEAPPAPARSRTAESGSCGLSRGALHRRDSRRRRNSAALRQRVWRLRRARRSRLRLAGG